jgi:hypothetical protein
MIVFACATNTMQSEDGRTTIDVDVANVPFSTAKQDCSSRVLLVYWPWISSLAM